MSRKDYVLIAAALHRSQMAVGIQHNTAKRRAAQDGIRLVAIDLAASLANDNPAFDRGRFMQAAGFGY